MRKEGLKQISLKLYDVVAYPFIYSDKTKSLSLTIK